MFDTVTGERLAPTDVAAIRDAMATVQASVERVVVGKTEVIRLLLVALLCEGHVLVEDVPGIGKTTLAKALAQSLGARFRRIQFTPDLMPADITGVHYFDPRAAEFCFREGPIAANIVLADELNRATPRTQSALLEAMEERQLTVEGVTIVLPRPFLVIATQNPIELEGTFPLPEAQLDRFLLRVRIGYPDGEAEEEMVVRHGGLSPLEGVQPVLDTDELLRFVAALSRLYLAPEVRRYAVQIVRATREEPALELGASPRASLALVRAARARAALEGRDYVLPDDVKAMAPHVLAHRLIVSSQARLRGRTAEDVLRDVIERVPVPIEG